jgi:hypothetical protein
MVTPGDMRAGAILASAWAAGTCLAQIVVEPRSTAGSQIVRAFEKLSGDAANTTLRCQVRPFQPILGFQFRYMSGYVVEVPLEDARGVRHLFSFTQVTPEKGTPVLLFQRGDLPVAPAGTTAPKGNVVSTVGGFQLGEGRYLVELLVADETGRKCREQWRITAPAQKTPLLQAPGTVEAVSLGDWRGVADTDKISGRVTVLMNAAPFLRRRHIAKLASSERSLLLGSLTTLLEQTRYRHARVVVFDLDRRRMLFEDEKFGPEGYQRLRKVLAETEYATIAYQTLRAGGGDWEMLDRLLAQESRRDETPEAIVFLGPSTRWTDGRPKPAKSLREGMPRLFYVALTPIGTVPQDTIQRTVRQLGGNVFAVYQPRDLARATKAIRVKGTS